MAKKPNQNADAKLNKKAPAKQVKKLGGQAVGNSKSTSTQFNISKTKRNIFILFIVLAVLIVGKGIFDAITLQQQEQQLEKVYQEKLAEKEKLERMKEYINSEAYIEQTARDLLKMVKPGEILYILKDKEDGDQEETLEKKTIVLPDEVPPGYSGDEGEANDDGAQNNGEEEE